jgi:serine/threonine-protein kinase
VAALLRRGSELGKYRLNRRLGRGAFAQVWKARDRVEHRDVALKITEPAAVAEFGREALEQEARIASRLHHPNIVPVRNADWIDGRLVLATDLAERSLAHYPRARRSPRVALEIVRQVAAGLGHAHAKGVLHRDVKPENILIFADGHAGIADFGASRFAEGVSRVYTEAGTLGYMAPEQAYGRPRFSSDVFSLGLIAYELLAGVLLSWPFEWPPESYRRFAARVPEPLQPVLRKAAEFEPRRRFADAEELSRALERAFARLAQPARRRPSRRRRRPSPPSPLAVQGDAFRRAHGKRLGMGFACHRCEGPIAEEMPFCPWCGTAENSFRELSRLPLVCPDCERGVRPEWRFCPWCYAGRFESNGRTPPPDPRAERTCSREGCGGQLRLFMRYCPMCKRKVRRPWSHPELPQRCPRCRWPSSPEFFRFCPWCSRHEPRAGSYSRHPRGRTLRS